MPHLLGRNIMLREYRQEDRPFISAWVNDTETTCYLSGIFVRPQTIKNTEDFLQRQLAGSDREVGFVIADRETQAYLGQVDLLQIEWRTRCATLGIVIGRDGDRSRGVGTEALQLVCDYGFGMLGLNRIQLEVYKDNLRGRRCYEKAGFVKEGVRREAAFLNGKFMDVIGMSILYEEWKKRAQDNAAPDAAE